MNKEQTQSQKIMRLKAEIEAKETNREAFSKAYDKLRAENSRLKAENERLKEVIADQNDLCWNCKKSVKEFAEKLKEEFIKSDNIQDSITAKKLFRDICPVKVDKVLKKFIKEKQL